MRVHPRWAIAVLVTTLVAPLLAAPPPTDPQSLLRDHLQELDRQLAGELARAESRAAQAAPPAAAARRQLAMVGRHLEHLEMQVRRGDFGPPAPWLERLQVLERLLRRVDRAAGLDPAAAAARVAARASLAARPKLKRPPVADTCETALPIGFEPVAGSTAGSGADGDASCGTSKLSPDVWYRFTPTAAADLLATTAGSSFDTVVSAHRGCPPPASSELACGDNEAGLQAVASFHAEPGEDVLLRVSGFAGAAGDYRLQLGPAATVTGRVVAAATGAPIENVDIFLESLGFTHFAFATTDAEGGYRIDDVAPDRYTAIAEPPPPFVGQVWGAGHCPAEGCDPLLGAAIDLLAPGAGVRADFALVAGGEVGGSVKDAASGAPIASAFVRLWPQNSGLSFTQTEITDAQGRYRFEGLAAGSYLASVTPIDTFVGELYGGAICIDPFLGVCDILSAVPIVVGRDRDASGVDFALDRGGGVAGTIVAASDGAPIPFVEVFAFETFFGSFLGSATTDVQGRYELAGIAPGEVTVGAEPSPPFLTELWDGVACPGSLSSEICDPTTGNAVRVELGATTEGIDFSLEIGGTITGTVSDATSGAALAGAMVGLVSPEAFLSGGVLSDGEGRYTLSGLVPGSYRIGVDPGGGHVAEIYDDVACASFFFVRCDLTATQPIEVQAGTTRAGIDFALRQGAKISGNVRRAADGEPQADRAITVWDAAGEPAGFAFTDAAGNWEVSSLPAGRYFASATADTLPFAAQVYDGVPCQSFACDPTSGTPIDVSAGQVVTGIDFALLGLGCLAGRVSDSASGAPLAFILISVRDASGLFAQFATTDAAGNYVVGDLDPGSYFVVTADSGAYRSEAFPDVACRLGVCDLRDAQPVVVRADATTGGVDFALDLGAAISGRLRDAYSGGPAFFVALELWREGGELIATATSDEQGRYVLPQLVQGTYFLRTRSPDRYRDQLYAGRDCGADCAPTSGTPIVLVGDGLARAGVDFDLLPLAPATCIGVESLCLAGERFAVRARWRDFGGTAALAHGRPLSDDSGYFWFFDRDNVEVVVKVLDTCAAPDPRFWVFVAGLTNVEVAIEVEDMLTGEVKTYQNALGEPFRPVLDTEGFATCTPDARAAGPGSRAEQVEKIFGDCESDSLGLCLNADRFRVEAFYETFDGATGQARAAVLTADSGYFWFFDDDNVEVVVKVLDACAQPEPRFWVFAAGLTNVEVLLRVTDTESGEVREYRNPLATPFAPVLDTGAFATCP